MFLQGGAILPRLSAHPVVWYVLDSGLFMETIENNTMRTRPLLKANC
jgi:hypothetical protein